MNLSHIFNKAIDWRLLDKILYIIKKHKQKSRSRYITVEVIKDGVLISGTLH
ncbi:hypothetical protein OTSSIDO_0323 [Orientia tsutsugamushi str. Sido]|nr:hypothetical protein OTSSIDO_0323 [Orientia tsutsugamushi str. Sido]